jgi:hypothetical protein
MVTKPPKRDNAYYFERLKSDFPSIHADWLAGAYPTVDAALKAAGLKKARTRLQELTNAWKHATVAEQSEFKRQIGCAAPPPMPIPTPTPTTASGTLPISWAPAPDRLLLPVERDRIQEIMKLRKMRHGDVMDEIGFKRLNPALGMAILHGYQLQPEMLEALRKWLAANAGIVSTL